LNNVSQLQLTTFQVTYVDAAKTRVSTETAYLTDEVLARSNLTVAINAQVTKIIIEEVNGVKRALGVEFTTHKEGGRTYRADAAKEVILS
jgi:choline dehydrogenase